MYIKRKTQLHQSHGHEDTRGGIGAVGIENWVLQNGGSFEKAARSFLEVAKNCESLSEFQSQYAIWDFGENYMAGDHYPHDNFVYNMSEDGYGKMKKALDEYVKTISIEQGRADTTDSSKKSLGEIVQEDMSVLSDTTYMQSVNYLLDKVRQMSRQSNEQQKGIGE